MNTEWTGERIDQLRKLYADGLSAAGIARKMGVTRNAIIGKLHRLELKRDRPPPKERRRNNNPIGFGGKRARVHPGNVARKRVSRRHDPGRSTLPPVTPPVKLLSEGIEDRAMTRCRFIIGDACGPDTLFCGAPTKPGRSWCGHHARICEGGQP